MAKKKNNKKSWLKKQVAKVQLLPWYWKLVATVAIFFLGGTFGTQLFTQSDDLMMGIGFVVLVTVLWFLIQMWLPASDKE